MGVRATGTNPKSYPHIIWDWNGTLVNDAALCVEILNDLLTRYGKPPVTINHYQRFFGFPVKDYYEKAGFNFTQESFETIATDWFTEYNRRRYECRLHDHALRTLRDIQEQGRQQFILSAYPQKHLEEVVDHYRIRSLFTDLSGLQDHFAASKSESGVRFLKKLGLPRSSVLMVGDTIHDFETANAMQVDCILIAQGHQSFERLSAACPIPIFRNLSEASETLTSC